MPHYAYRGRSGKGELAEGVLEYPSSSDVANYLTGIGVTPLSIKLCDKPVGSRKVTLHSLTKQKIQPIDVMLFSRQMHTLLKAGIPILSALNGLKSSTNNQSLAEVIADVKESLESGRELSAALAKHPQAFSSFYVNMIRVGESTGMLDRVFLRLFDHLEFEKFMHDQVRAAMRYPTFVIIAMAIAIVVVNIFVIPAFATVFKGFNSELPLMTRGLLGFSNFTVTYWPLLLAGLILTVYSFKKFVRTRAGKYRWDRFKLRLPIAGKIVHKSAMARFARSFSMAGNSGVPVTSGLRLVEQTTDNDYIAKRVAEMREGVERGESIFRTATNSGVFNPVVLQMIAVGEESGSLDELMEEIAEMYQRDVEYDIKTLGSQIEPILIVFLGIMVLILALGIFLPIWDLGKVALHKA